MVRLKRTIVFIISFCIVVNVVPMQVSSKEESIRGDISGYLTGKYKIVDKLLKEYKFGARQGHGFAAERGNNLVDKLQGKNAEVVGDNNVANGPDRKIVNKDGTITWIQDKYYRSAKETVDACFDVETGKFRYYDGDGNPMLIEVPSDQYENAVVELEKKIENGHVDGVSDPKEAKNIIKKGKLSYKQARNLTKACTKESLLYDSVSGVISSGCAFGISAVINFAVMKLNGKSTEDATKEAALEGLKTGGQVFCISIISSQLAKAGFMKVFEPSSEALVKSFGRKFAETLVKSVGRNAAEFSGETLTKTAARVLRSNIVVDVVAVAVLSVGDVRDLFAGRISAKQMIKNLSITVVSVAGGTATGIAIGSATSPLVGTLLGGLAGAGIGFISEKAVSLFVKDDTEEMYDIISKEFQNLCSDYIISEKEGDELVTSLQGLLTGEKLKDMYESKDREKFANELLMPLFEKQINKRSKITAPSNAEMRLGLKESLKGVVFIH